jgi:hypothetical protein
MIIRSSTLASEMRRRRVGRPALLERLDRSERQAWLPGELREVPTTLLVLAAMNLTNSIHPTQS